MGPVHLWAELCSRLVFVGAVLTLCSTTVMGQNNTQLRHGFDDEYLQRVKGLVVPLTFLRFTEPLESTIKVRFSSTTQVVNIAELLLVVIKYNGTGPSEQSYVKSSDPVDSIAANTEVNYSFPTDIRLPTIEEGGEVGLVLIAHDDQSSPLAAGEFKFTFKSTSASLAWVGAAIDDRATFLRVGSGSPVSIGTECSCNGAQPCYCPKEQVPVGDLEICVEVTGTGNGGGGNDLTVLQCDGDVTPTAFADISSIDSAELHTKSEGSKEFKLDATYKETSDSVQVIFFTGELPSDTNPEECPTDTKPCITTPPDSETFKILLVALDEKSAVIESRLESFEDYLIITNQLSSNAVEVLWSGSSSIEYEVIIDDSSAPFKKTVGNACVNETCKAYFVKTTAPLKCTVYKTETPTMMTSISLNMDSDPLQATFTSINKQEGATTTIKIQSASAINSGDAVSLVVITVSDEEGSEDIYDGTPVKTKDSKTEDSEYEFPVDLKSSGDNTYFILVAHKDADVTIAGTAAGVIKEFDTQLAWVGNTAGSTGATLRITTTDELVSFGRPCSCTSTESPCYCIHTVLEADDIVVCSDLDDGVQYCDKSVNVIPYQNITTISKSRLMYPRDTPGGPFYEFVATGAKYELLFFLIDDTPQVVKSDEVNSCNINECNVPLPGISADAGTYYVLAVVLDDLDVILESREFLFEDSKVIVEKLLDDLLWVKWTPAEDFTYSIDCMPETSGYPDPSPTSQRCDGTDVQCMVIFSDLKCDDINGVYTGEVTKNGNKVAGQELMTCDSAYTKDVHISRLVQERRSSGSSTMSVCFTAEELNSTAISSLSLLLYNQEGLIYQAQDPKQGEAEGDFCFAPLTLDVESMDLNQPLTLIVHPTKQARAELYLLDVSLNQVEENTLKTNWKSKNNPTNYTIMFDGQITGIDSKECLQYGDCVKYLHMEEGQKGGQKETGKSITIIEEGAVIQELHLDIPEYTRTDSES